MTFSGRGLYASSSKEPHRRHFGWLFIGACVAVVALVVGGLSAVGNVASTESHSDAFDGVEKLLVDNQTSGEVQVTGTDGDTVTVERTLRANPLISAKEDLRAENGDTVRADARCAGPLPFGAFGGCRVDYRIGVPEDVDLDVTTRSGAVDIRSVQGDVTASASSGPVELEDVTGDVTADTTSGNVRVDGVEGDMDLKATSGSIWARGSGTSLRATTTSGGVDLAEVSATNVEAEATSGSVTVNGDFETAEAGTTSGSVDIETSEPFDRIVADATSGSIAVRVPEGAYAVTGDSTSGGRDIEVDRDGGAEARIDASTTSGNVDITPIG